MSRLHQSPGPLFSFVFCNDLHLSTPRHAAFLGGLVDDWLNSDIDFLVVGGDLVNNGTAEEMTPCKQQLDRLRKPYYLIAGNHDVTGDGREGQANLASVFGGWKPNMLIHHKGVVLIFLDLTNGTRAHVTVPDSTARWVQRQTARLSPNVPVVVFSHFSIHPDVPRFPVGGASGLFDALDGKNLLAWFAGHYHGSWHGIRNGADYFTNTCMSPVAGNHDGTPREGYLRVKVFPAGVRVKWCETPPARAGRTGLN